MITTISLVTALSQFKVFIGLLAILSTKCILHPQEAFYNWRWCLLSPFTPSPIPHPLLSGIQPQQCPAGRLICSGDACSTPASHPAPPSPSPAAPQVSLSVSASLFPPPANRLISTIVPGFLYVRLKHTALAFLFLTLSEF